MRNFKTSMKHHNFIITPPYRPGYRQKFQRFKKNCISIVKQKSLAQEVRQKSGISERRSKG